LEPHPFFFAFVAAVVLGAIASGFAGGDAPGYALHSNLVYRLEVGGVVLAFAYVLAVAGWLAWQGRAMRVELGPAVVDPSAATGLDEAASGFEELETKVSSQLEEFGGAFEDIEDRLKRLEGK
jgi:hypothetical protein